VTAKTSDLPTITAPFTVLIDGREKAPYRFTGIDSDARDGRRKIIVPTKWAHLKSGDYTVDGLQDIIAVERKSLKDLYGTLGQDRARFQAEHERMAKMQRAVVVIEASWFEIINMPPSFDYAGEMLQSKLPPKTVFRTALSWHVRYGVPWIVAEDRRFAEIYTFRFLEKCWKEFGNDGVAERDGG
jgi:DNA excision repair protein ERCC-4